MTRFVVWIDWLDESPSESFELDAATIEEAARATWERRPSRAGASAVVGPWAGRESIALNLDAPSFEEAEIFHT